MPSVSPYALMHLVIVTISTVGIIRSWRALKLYPEAIVFARWPLSLLWVLLVCSMLTIIDLTLIDLLPNQALNTIAAVQLFYSAVVALKSVTFFQRMRRD
jgi:hypothetical protein